MAITVLNGSPLIWVLSDGTPDLTTVTSLNFKYTDADLIFHNDVIPASNFLLQTATLISFVCPDACNFTVGLTTVTIEIFAFSGTVDLGPNAVIITNGSGIYTLVSEQAHDKVYLDSETGQMTGEVKIPDPYFRTGYIGG